MALFSDHSHLAPAHSDLSAVVQASDIPILSATDRLQRTLLRWVDVCGLSGQFILENDVVDALSDHDFLDDRSYIVEIEGKDPSRWLVVWAGTGLSFSSDIDFRQAFASVIPEDRYAELVAREYHDAIEFRRASARRFVYRNQINADTMDQLIFPVRDAGRSEYVLVVGEAVTGRSLYKSSDQVSGQ